MVRTSFSPPPSVYGKQMQSVIFLEKVQPYLEIPLILLHLGRQ